MLPVLRLRTWVILLVCATLIPALLITGLLVSWQIGRHTRSLLAGKAAVAATLAAQEEAVVETLAGRRSPLEARAFAERLRWTAGVDYVVVLDMAGNRLTHPNPARIGEHFLGGDDGGVFQGRTYTSVAEGTLGTALRVFTPVRDADGRQVGAVVAGVLMTDIDHQLLVVRRMILAGLVLGGGVGILCAFLVSSRIKGVMLGMEPEEIASVLQARTADLLSARESLLAEQLAGVKHYAGALRGQTHEFMNKLHVILGLARLGETARLAEYLADVTQMAEGDLGSVARAVKDPVLAGFLLARISSAREQDLRVALSPEAPVPEPGTPAMVHDAITILGNFLENAAEAIGSGGDIRVDLRVEDGQLAIQVEDTGPGLPGGDPEHLFVKGFSTKGTDRGLGLHHARQRVAALGGSITASNREGGGARFRAVIPFHPEEAQA